VHARQNTVIYRYQRRFLIALLLKVTIKLHGVAFLPADVFHDKSRKRRQYGKQRRCGDDKA